jgi:hypothetical protein
MFQSIFSFVGIIVTPFIDFTLYSMSSFLVNPHNFKISMQKRALED